MASRVELLRDLDAEDGWLLAVDGVPQSYVDLARPTHLEFEYIRLMGEVLDCLAPPPARLDVVHLGGGGCTLARYVAATRPGSRQLVLEADEEIVAVGRARLRLDTVDGLEVRLADARAGLQHCSDDSADVVVTDVFDGPQVPAHLLTMEALVDVRRVLHGHGVLLVNVADAAPFGFARRVVAACRTVFDHVVVLGDPGVLRGRRFGNLVPVASRQPLPVGELSRLAARTHPAVRLVEGEDLEALVRDADPATDLSPARAPAPPDWTLGGRSGS